MKKTVILIIAAMMALPLSYADAVAADASSAQQVEQKKPKKEKKQKAEIKEVTFHVFLHCEDCVEKVFDNVSRLKGIKDLDVSLEHQTVYVKYDASKTSEDVLKASIEKLGYPVKGKLKPGQKPQHNHEAHNHEGHDHGHKH